MSKKNSIFVHYSEEFMRRYTILLPVLLFAISATAQAQVQRVLRTQFMTYDTREDALAERRGKGQRFIAVVPEDAAGNGRLFTQAFEAGVEWGDCNAYLHLENVGSAYTLALNGHKIAEVEDALTPADFMISDAMVQGRNVLAIILRDSRLPQIEQSGSTSKQAQFADSYIFGQRKAHIDDFSARILPDTAGDFARLHLDIAVVNNFNGDETISVGYDITSPAGKLLDYTVREITLEGHARDTIHISTPIYDASKYAWGDNKGDAPLYSVMLYIKRNGRPEEYIPFKAAYGQTEFADGKATRLGREVKFTPRRYTAAADRLTVRKEIAALKREGVNTLHTDFPQPAWFYDECDRAGVYVFDRAAINASENRDDRTKTPSNDPAMVDEYISRIDAMYYRMRNHPCVAGFLLGGETGNGYAMYKTYQHLKSVEDLRPVVCEDADGEWNSDL